MLLNHYKSSIIMCVDFSSYLQYSQAGLLLYGFWYAGKLLILESVDPTMNTCLMIYSSICHSKPLRLSFHPTLKDVRLFILLFLIQMHRHGQFQAPKCQKIPLRDFIPRLLKSNWKCKSLFTSDLALCGSKI